MNTSTNQEIIRSYIKLQNKQGLVKYLESLGHDSKVVHPDDPTKEYHKAVGSIDDKPTGKYGWGMHINGHRVNIYLMTNSEVADDLMRK